MKRKSAVAPRIILNATSQQQQTKSTLPTFKAFRTRKPREWSDAHRLNLTIENDTAIQAYFESIKAKPKNDNTLPVSTRRHALGAVRFFLEYIGFETTDHAISDLIQHKLNNPNDMQIETALRLFSNLSSEGYHLRSQRDRGIALLGIFRANFAPLKLRVSNHFEPRTENCTEGIFQTIYAKLNPEQQAMIQWQLYAPERANAIYNVPFSDIDLSRKDVAVITIQKLRTKARTTHPCLIPKQFAEQVIESAKRAGRKTPFPNHETLWRQIRHFAQSEYNVLLHSHYLRKRFQTIAEQTEMPPNHYALLMGEKPHEGHLPNIYSLAGQTTVFAEELIKEYKTYLASSLTLLTSSGNSLPRDTNANAPERTSEETTQHHTSRNISAILSQLPNLD